MTRDASRLYHALANKYRRAVVGLLDETHMPIPRDALTTYVAKQLFPKCTGSDFIAFRDQILLQLHHLHLPILAEAGIIELEANQIMPGGLFADAVALIEDTP